jgi:sulfur-oxidizing protein SoxX
LASRARDIRAAALGALMLAGVCAQAPSFAQDSAQKSASPAASALVYDVREDAIPAPLGGLTGDPARGRAIVADRQKGLCLLCHAGPFPEQRFQGDIAPDLAGAGARWSVGQLRMRMVDAARLNPATSMPSYHRTQGLARVAPAFQAKPILDAQEIEDVVAFLAGLRDGPAAQEKP